MLSRQLGRRAWRHLRPSPLLASASRRLDGTVPRATTAPWCRGLSSEAEPREAMEFDVVTVGAGPAGLSAAIRLKQLAQSKGHELSVCVVEKGAEVGAHILSGNVFETRALDELIPDWKEKGAPIDTPVTKDTFLFLTHDQSIEFPRQLLPPQQHNEGNYIISLSQLVRWLGQQAEELGVEVYAGFSASEVLYRDDGSVAGVATRDVGIGKDGTKKSNFQPGIELRGRQEVMKKFNLRSQCDPQAYGLGIKEVWEVPEDKLQPGLVTHTLGWPLQHSPLDKTFGGSFMYHMKPNLILMGLVIGLSYDNPYINPYKEFQRWKTHPAIRKHIEGGRCISYGARVLNEGGYHSIPKLTFPGGALLGCSAGLLNSVKIKGTHTAMKSGMMAADALYEVLAADPDKTVASAGAIDPEEKGVEVTKYQAEMEKSWVFEELHAVRNVYGAFKSGLVPGVVHAGLVTHVTKGKEPWTLRSKKTDSERTGQAKSYQPIDYPKPDNTLTFDLLTNLQRSGTYHEGDQPSHLRVKPDLAHVPSDVSYPDYAGPEQRFCPAGVYEYKEDGNQPGKQELVINAQNCVHCKCCSIKMPKEYIKWTVPEGGGGPAYTIM